MSTLILYLYLILYITTSLNEETQCITDELYKALSIKDKQIADLTQKLAIEKSRHINTDLTDDYKVLTCEDVPKELHLRDDEQCIHECIEPNSCSDMILSCYPYDNCIIYCFGHGSCNHLQIDFIRGPATLQCDGFNSCKGMTLNSIEEYEFDDGIVNRGYLEKYEINPDEPWQFYLPDIKFQLSNVIDFQDDDIIFNEHYILAKNILKQDILDRIDESYQRCLSDGDHTEHREFGGGIYDDVEGHEVTFMDDCLDEIVYHQMKNITIGLLKYIQKYTNNALLKQNISINDNQGIQKYITDNWQYNWQQYVELANKIDVRVIEYIQYSLAGNLGWHTDDDSNFTVVSALTDSNDYDGGHLYFRLNFFSDIEHELKLQKGDVIFFPSMTDHKVEPIQSGERKVMVFEWWDIGRNSIVGRTSPIDHLEQLQQPQQQQQIEQDQDQDEDDNDNDNDQDRKIKINDYGRK